MFLIVTVRPQYSEEGGEQIVSTWSCDVSEGSEEEGFTVVGEGRILRDGDDVVVVAVVVATRTGIAALVEVGGYAIVGGATLLDGDGESGAREGSEREELHLGWGLVDDVVCQY